jgi:hypothetical protein
LGAGGGASTLGAAFVATVAVGIFRIESEDDTEGKLVDAGGVYEGNASPKIL